MGPSDNRRVYGELARQLTSSEELIDEQRTFLAACFERLSAGEDANVVFGLKSRAGQRALDAERRRMLSFLLHLVATLVDSGLEVEAACAKVSDVSDRLPTNGPAYDAAYLRQCWYQYPHMRSTKRSLYDPDFPYEM
jgi:hypothetical protein